VGVNRRHKADLAADLGKALSDQARNAILDTGSVVGVVLNAIDDTLDKGTTTTRWTVEAVKYLGPVLDEARRAGRPVILTADHGHVLDRGQPIHPATSDSARYRTGVPGPGSGEIAIRGERVFGGEVIVAVDESIHYTPRKAGYHGGASAAEVVIPVITLLPSGTLCRMAGRLRRDPSAMLRRNQTPSSRRRKSSRSQRQLPGWALKLSPPRAWPLSASSSAAPRATPASLP
jgi:hypothetical protein